MNSFILTNHYTPACLPAGTARRGIIGIPACRLPDGSQGRHGIFLISQNNITI